MEHSWSPIKVYSTTDQGRSYTYKLVGHSRAVDCFNRVLDCYIRVYRSFSIFIGRAQPTFGWAWALPGPPLATPLLQTNIDAYQYSFYPSAIRLWNTLPTYVIEANSLEDFQRHLLS